jgi:abhydrolase domain-containing protein 6
MKKVLWFGLGLIVILVVALYFVGPAVMYEQAVNAERAAAGLVRKAVQVDDHQIAYLEGGSGEVVVLLHGFGAEKDNWDRFAKYLQPGYQVFIPDLPGFGESTKSPAARYDMESQVKRLDRFVEALNLTKFHLAGNSMGGMIACEYAAQYPRKVLTVGLMAPGGIFAPNKSDVIKLMEKGENPLLVKTPEDFDRILALLFVNPPPFPPSFKKILAKRAMAGAAFNEKIFKDMSGDFNKTTSPLAPFLPKVEAPALIIWGDRDRILDVSGVPILEKGLKIRKTVIMKDTGHVPMMEKPQETALAYRAFIEKAARR